ncbi:hypothetical protein AAZX31_14G033900 [Glycine max]
MNPFQVSTFVMPWNFALQPARRFPKLGNTREKELVLKFGSSMITFWIPSRMNGNKKLNNLALYVCWGEYLVVEDICQINP